MLLFWNGFWKKYFSIATLIKELEILINHKRYVIAADFYILNNFCFSLPFPLQDLQANTLGQMPGGSWILHTNTRQTHNDGYLRIVVRIIRSHLR